MPRALNSRTSDSSPATRNESSFEMTSAATFFPAKLTEPASSDLKVAVNVIAAEIAATADPAIASVIMPICTSGVTMFISNDAGSPP